MALVRYLDSPTYWEGDGAVWPHPCDLTQLGYSSSKCTWGSLMFARSLKFVLPIIVMFSGETASSADPLKIRLAWAVVPSELSPILFVKPGIAKHVGVSYTVEPI